MSFYRSFSAYHLVAVAAALLMVSIIIRPISADQPVWIGPAAGDWNEPTNWSTGVVPGADSLVTIDASAGQDSLVTVSSDQSAFDLIIAAGDGVQVLSEQELEVSGFFTLDGEMVLDSESVLRANGPFRIGATGRLQLKADADNALVSRDPWLTHQPFENYGVISGAGSLDAAKIIHNFGLVLANVPGQQLVTTDSSPGATRALRKLVNRGTLRAENGATLYLPSTDVVSSSGLTAGRIEADIDSTVILYYTRIEGGVLASSIDSDGLLPQGSIDSINGRLKDVSIDGQVTLQGVNTLVGEIANHGTMTVEGYVDALEVLTLSGGGVLEFRRWNPFDGIVRDGLALNYTFGSTGAIGFINLDNTIRGHGRIIRNDTSSYPEEFTNRALIESGYGAEETPVGEQYEMQIVLNAYEYGEDNNDLIARNTGTLRATRGNRFLLSGANLLNAEGSLKGVIEAESGSVFRVEESEVRGGILRAGPAIDATGESPAIPAGLIEVKNSVMHDVHIESGVVVQVVAEGDSEVPLLSGKILNEGRIEAKSILIAKYAELRGGGQLVLGDGEAVVRSTPETFGGFHRLTNIDNELILNSVRIENLEPRYDELWLDNFGTILSIGSSRSHITNTLVVNGGLIQANSGSELWIDSVDSSGFAAAEARIHAEVNSKIRINALIGGTVTTDSQGMNGEQGGIVELNSIHSPFSSSHLQDVINHGHIWKVGGTYEGIVENHGLIEAFAQGRVSDAVAELTGSGELRFRPVLGSGFTEIFVGHATSLKNHLSHTITGEGTVTIRSGVYVNEGTMRAVGADESLGVRLINPGTNGTEFHQTGTLRSGDGGEFLFRGDEGLLRNRGLIDVMAEGTFRTWDGDVINMPNAEIRIDGDLELDDNNTIDNLASGLITGSGIIRHWLNTPDSTSVINSGTVSPGNSVGMLTLEGNFLQNLSGILEIEVEGFDLGEALGGEGELQHDVLFQDYSTSTSRQTSADLAGELRFLFDESLTPELGDAVTFLFVDQIVGQFDTVTGLPELDPGLMWTLVLEASGLGADQSLAAKVAVRGDFNADGFFDAADYTVWRDGLGVLFDHADYLVWRNNYGSAVPAGLVGSNVPEPSALLLLVVALSTCTRCRLRDAQ